MNPRQSELNLTWHKGRSRTHIPRQSIQELSSALTVELLMLMPKLGLKCPLYQGSFWILKKFEKKRKILILKPDYRTTCQADKTNHPVKGLSLNRSQCGSCSTKYDTPAGT